jgi:hypothetical protein
MKYYRPHFAGKTILCNCNDALHTGFATHFSLAFEVYGLKELICTSFNPDGQGMVYRYHGDTNENGVPDIEEWDKMPMEGNGGFNTPEGIALIQEADIIVTNPPFSLFREFITLLMEHNKKFIVIGNLNAISYKEIFPLIKDNKMWIGNGFQNGNAYFRIDTLRNEYAEGVFDESTNLVKFRNCCWYTNIDHGRRHQPLKLMTMAENFKHSKHKEIRGRKDYVHYENYDAIDVPFTDAIPSDYNGAMGVPITFLDKYCPEQFEIIGHPHGDYGLELGLKPYPRELKELNKGLRDGDLYYMKDGKPELPYRRILIQKKQV